MPATIHADDLYERLGIERTASRDEVRAAYRALLRQYPPERAPEEFKRIREAYETLNDSASREEYDRAPSPAVQRLLRLASASMEARAYPDAEQHLKRVLVEDPTLDYARNWLGLCYLYQEKPAQALPQFETARAYAAVAVLSAFAISLFGALALAERLLIPWAHRTTTEGDQA